MSVTDDQAVRQRIERTLTAASIAVSQDQEKTDRIRTNWGAQDALVFDNASNIWKFSEK